ncbi:hypothetical protein [Thauera sp. SWB20]|uniref:hypothetical protein n=1 Tax=Thauera sp. SWB20 TaxID=1572758 RepID=UPI0005ADC51F|nr:hypothetical protein [Thauera sp. SWB20]KIN89030.1 hypothetical protein PO78_222 [Thauera sp. SWB20]
MSIKQLCFDTHTQLRDQHGIAVRRTHLYELLAALLGFNSHAALAADAVIGQVRQTWKFTSDDLARLSKRCLALGYPAAESQRIVEAVTALAETHRLVAVDVKYLVKLIAGDADGWNVDDEEMPDDVGIDQASPWQHAPDLDLGSPLLIDALEQLAAKDHADAHYALALLLECEPPEDRDGHWYRQQLAGRRLDGPEKEWADDYAAALAQFDQYRQHMATAARLGRADAAVAWADLTAEEGDFQHALSLATPEDATRLFDLADRFGARAMVVPLLRQAALTGDVEAMRRLAEDFEPDAVEAWTWVHLAELCGTDLTRMEAVYEDGSPVDDDIPGNIFAVGGIDVPDISAEQHVVARRVAARRFEDMRNR